MRSAPVLTEPRTRGSRKAEHIERSSLGGDVLQVAHGVDEAKRRRPIAHVEVAGDHSARPAADARENSHVLPPVRTPVSGWLADDPGGGFELPQHLAGAGVDGFKPALHVGVEDHVAGRHDRAAPDREVLLNRPDRTALLDVPGLEHATVPAGTGLEARL